MLASVAQRSLAQRIVAFAGAAFVALLVFVAMVAMASPRTPISTSGVTTDPTANGSVSSASPVTTSPFLDDHPVES